MKSLKTKFILVIGLVLVFALGAEVNAQDKNKKVRYQLLTCSPSYAKNPTFTQTYFLEILSINNFNYEDSAMSYMKTFHRNIWRKCRNDEFLKQEQISVMVEEMKKKTKQVAKQVGFETVFTCNITAKLGDYDFKRSMFPVFNEMPYRKTIEVCGSEWGVKNFITLANEIDFRGIWLAMEKSKAKKFLSDSENRRITARIFYKITGLAGSGRRGLKAEILNCAYYLDKGRTDLLISMYPFGTIKDEAKVKVAPDSDKVAESNKPEALTSSKEAVEKNDDNESLMGVFSESSERGGFDDKTDSEKVNEMLFN